MNICLVIEGTYPWYMGGVSEWLYRYLLHFPNDSFDIIQIATDEYRFSSLEQAYYPLLENIRSFTRIAVPELNNPSSSSYEKWWRYEEIDLNSLKKCQLVQVTNTGFAGLLGVHLSESLHIPLVLTEHAIYWKEIELGTPALECGYRLPETAEEKSDYVNNFKKIADLVYSRADTIISVSKSNVPYQQQLGANSIRYIPNGVDKQLLKPSSSAPTGKENYLKIGWIGRCAQMKNPLAFFEYVDEFQRRTNLVEFIMMIADAGEDDLMQQVKEKARQYQNFQLLINCKSRDYLDQMDALCITSLHESQPLVILEALAQFVLPFGREVGDATAEYGLLFPATATIPAIVDHVLDLYRNKEVWQTFLMDKHQIIRDMHTWDKIFREYKMIYERTIYSNN
ncbi:MAG: GT4 family glycosyltransferase PelF [Calditrichia bacterium]